MVKRFEDLTLQDDFMFCKVMQNEFLCKTLIEMILSYTIGKITYISVQHSINTYEQAKSVRFDVLVQTENGKFYDVEMQVSNEHNIPKRMRYYQAAIESKNDIPKIRYKIGYIKYNLQDYADALGSFMKAGEDVPDDINFLLAMGNTLSLRNDNFASQGYYEHLLDELNLIIDRKQIIFPQARASNAEIVDSYMKGMNNLGVTLYRLAKRTGSSMYNAKAMVSFQESLRAWDTLSRNQETMLRLPGGNLAEQNLKYISHPLPEYEPAIYTELPKTLYDEEELR